jgi:DNA-binding protein HU-beta
MVPKITALLINIIEGVKYRSKIHLVGFGTFYKKYRKARQGRNPQTGKIPKIGAKNVVRFKPDQEFAEAVR